MALSISRKNCEKSPDVERQRYPLGAEDAGETPLKISNYIAALTALIGAIVLITTGAVDLSTIADHNTITIAGAVLGVRAQRVLRLHQLPDYLGLRRSQISELVKAGLLHPFAITPNGRPKVVLEDEVAALQASAIETARAAATSKPGPLPKSLRGKSSKRETDEARAL